MNIYLSLNEAVDQRCLRAIALVTLELSIKNNEDKVISFDECSKVLINDKEYVYHHAKIEDEQKCVIKMLSRLEKHIVQTIQFKMNLPTTIDFMLLFSYGSFAESEALDTCLSALPWLYFIEMNYSRSRSSCNSSIALAALIYALLKRKSNEMMSCLMV